MHSAFLQAISYYFPEKCLTNEELSGQFPEWQVDKIAAKTGIYSRYISADNETACDMAEKAAKIFFNEYPIDKASIDFLILCTQSPDYFLPTTACILQEKIGLKNGCGAFDFNLGCSGFVYGLGIAKGLVVSGQANNVLLITSETYSKYLHPLDKSCRTIFGDAASVSLITSQTMPSFYNAEICEFSYKTVGSDFQNLIVETGGMRVPQKGKCLDETINGMFVRNHDFLWMDGKAIFDFTAFNIPEHIQKNAGKNNLNIEEIDLFIFHQANKYMLNFLQKRCGIPVERFYINLADGGNTVSSTISIALKKAIQDIKIKDGMAIQLCGFGVGLSIGSVILKTIG
jgi:3-oxoacyl-[acyl-carrier-protein] synthase-3